MEFNIEKLQQVEAEKRKIRQEYERKTKQVEVHKKIEYTMQLNASRIKVLQAQDDVLNSMKESASKQLLHVSTDNKTYSKLLKDLIVQSLLRLKKPPVLLWCREADRKLVESVIDEAKQQYAEKAKVQSPKVTIDNCVFLPPPPTDADLHGPSCSGGVVLASDDGKIVCENTLDTRLDVVFRQKLPEVVCEEMEKVPFFPSNVDVKQSCDHRSKREGPPNEKAIPQCYRRGDFHPSN